MDLSRNIRCRAKQKIITTSLEQLYPHDVMLYRIPPIEDITIENFEELAIERLKLFRIFNEISLKAIPKYSQEWRNAVILEVIQQNLKTYIHLIKGCNGLSIEHADKFRYRRNDYISHFCLRVAFVKSMELQS